MNTQLADSISLLLTETQAAKALSISPRSLWAIRKKGEIPWVSTGRSVRYDVRDIQSWIDRKKINTEPSNN